MIRMSALRNCPVICGEERVGYLQSITLDAARKRVCALVVSCGMRGKKTVFAQCISDITDTFILVTCVSRYEKMLEKKDTCFVRDTTGLLAGFVTDYAIDEREKKILAVEIASGYTPAEYNRRIWIYSYRHGEWADELIVPVDLGNEPIHSEKGDWICAYPP